MKKLLIICLFALILPLSACQLPSADLDQPVAAPEQPVAAQEQPVAAQEQPVADQEPPMAGDFAEIATLDIYGNIVEGDIFTDYELTMVNIWATYCGPCIAEMPYLGEMAANMPEGTHLIGLVVDIIDEDYLKLACTIAEDTGANYPHLLMDAGFYIYVNSTIVGVPTTIFIDGEGRLIGEQMVGMHTREAYEEELEKRLAQVREGNV